MLHVALLPSHTLTHDPPPQKSVPAQSFLLPRITYCPDNALCISEAIKLPHGFFASPSSFLFLFPSLFSLLSVYRYDCAAGNSGKVSRGSLRRRCLEQRFILFLYRIIRFATTISSEFWYTLPKNVKKRFLLPSKIFFRCKDLRTDLPQALTFRLIIHVLLCKINFK